MASHCVFCRIAAGTDRAWRVYEDEHAVAFLDRRPVTRGHLLVIPRRHADELWTISAGDAANVMVATHHVASVVRDQLRPDGMTLFQATRPAGWQDVFHLHVHVVPRYVGDRLVRPWDVGAADSDELDEVLRQLTRS
jgi:histidine triad (HIT) family protein